MRGLLLEVPEELLAERRRKGLDVFDEMWEGVLHLVPPPSSQHQGFGAELVMTLGPVAKRRGLEVFYETGLFRTDKDYRVPDIAFVLPAQRLAQGLSGAELVVEILSPDDETYEKLPFYAERGVRELLVVNPESRSFELYALRGSQYVLVSPGDSGSVRSQILEVSFSLGEGPKLLVAWQDGSAAI
jgi:Uma2 family endonuclease